MATANLRPRRARAEPQTRISVALEEASPTGSIEEQGKRPAFPWMQITDAMLERVGFLPGQQVLFSIDDRYGHITITPDHDYMIGNRYLTGPEAEDTRQRLSRRN